MPRLTPAVLTEENDLDHLRVVRIGQAADLFSVSRPTLYAMVKRGELPPPRRFSSNAVGWTVAELRQWVDTREAA